jgi:hypothetical protein
MRRGDPGSGCRVNELIGAALGCVEFILVGVGVASYKLDEARG